MVMSGIGTDCPMASQMAAGNCLQDCCARIDPQSIVLPAVVTKLNFGQPASPSVASSENTTPETNFALRALVGTGASSPPLYLLVQVFRV